LYNTQHAQEGLRYKDSGSNAARSQARLAVHVTVPLKAPFALLADGELTGDRVLKRKKTVTWADDELELPLASPDFNAALAAAAAAPFGSAGAAAGDTAGVTQPVSIQLLNACTAQAGCDLYREFSSSRLDCLDGSL
jgi:hypothetical protein